MGCEQQFSRGDLVDLEERKAGEQQRASGAFVAGQRDAVQSRLWRLEHGIVGERRRDGILPRIVRRAVGVDASRAEQLLLVHGLIVALKLRNQEDGLSVSSTEGGCRMECDYLGLVERDVADDELVLFDHCVEGARRRRRERPLHRPSWASQPLSVSSCS